MANIDEPTPSAAPARTPQISVLGPLRIGRADEERSPGPRLEHLLAVLVARRGNVSSVEALADAIWHGEPPEAAPRTLRTYVSRLRAALGDDGEAVAFRRSGYVLVPEAVDIDVDLFDGDVEQGLLALQTADVANADTLLRRALSRWRGVPYGAHADEEWARPERVRLEERRTEVEEALVEVLLTETRIEEAIAAASALVETHPLRERPRELLMRSMYLGGRQADAVRAYRSYRERLAEETGLEPSVDLAALEGRILTGDLPRTAPARRARGYELGEPLGRGAFSVVHRAIQPGLGRQVAVKIIRSELADQAEFVRRFEHEARIAAAVEHPHVVPLHDFWRDPGAAYLVMRWMRGGSHADALRARGPLSRDQLCRVLDEIGGALGAAHRRGVVHRDVRPANLLLDEDGATYLSDFGIAVASTLALLVHPLHYAAPELLRGETAQAPADVHSLGVATFELLTGRLPLADATDRTDLVRRQLTEALPSARSTRSDLPARLDEVLARATAKVADDRHRSVEEFVDDVVAALTSRPGPRAMSPSANPYVGLHAFDETDADRFFGREHLVGELADIVERHRLAVVVGPSGVGKSSVVRAGLVPALRGGAVPGSESWFITTMIPATDPLAALEAALLRIAVHAPSTLREQLAEPGGILRSVRRVLPDGDATLLVVIDQFEELFTSSESDETRSHFLGELAAALDAPGTPLRVVATLRADRYDAPLREPAIAQLVAAGTVTVRPMGAEELERTIVQPARSAGADVEPALVSELVAGVLHRPASLPLLQFALTELYDRRVANVMLLDTHRAAGGLTGALGARAERIVQRGDERDAAIVRRITGRLVTVGESSDHDLRRRVPLAELGDDERTKWLIEELVRARLLVVDVDDASREPTLDIAHEALLRDWPRLREWIDEDRADLRVRRTAATAATDWDRAGRDDGLLARGGRLELVADLARRRPDLLNELETTWVGRSTAAADDETERARRQNVRLRRLLVAAALLLVLATAAVVFSIQQRDRAETNASVAETNASAAEARELVLEAERAIDDDPELAVLLGLEAVEAFRSSGSTTPMSALQTLRSAIAATHVRDRLPGGGWVAPLPETNEIATADGDGGIAIWDLENGAQVGTLTIDGWSVTEAQYERGALVVAASSEGSNGLFRVEMGTGEVRELATDIPPGLWANVVTDGEVVVRRPTPEVAEVEWLADGRRETVAVLTQSWVFGGTDVLAFATGSTEDPSVMIVDRASGARTTIEQTAFPAEFVSVSPDGESVAISRQVGDVAIYDLATGELIGSPMRFDRASSTEWSADGTLVATGGEGSLNVIDAATATTFAELDIHDGGTWSYEFIGDSHRLATAGIADDVTLVVDPLPGSEVGLPPMRLPIVPTKVTGTDGGLVLVSDRADPMVADPAAGEIAWSADGVNDTGWSDVAATFPSTDRGRRFVTVDDGRSHLLRISDGEPLWEAPDGWSILGVENGGRRVVIARHDEATEVGEAFLVELGQRGGELDALQQTELEDPGAFLGFPAFSPNGDLVLLSSLAGGRGVLYTDDGAVVHEFPAAPDVPFAWEFGADGTMLYGGNVAGDVYVFEVERLRDGATAAEAEVRRLDAHDNIALVGEISPDGRFLITQSQADPARVWDLESFELVAEFGTGDEPTSVGFHGTEPWVHVAVGNVLTTHTLDTEQLIAAARGVVRRELVEDECLRYLRASCDG